MAGETDVAGSAVDAAGFGQACVVEAVEVGVEDAGAVEGEFELVAADFDLLGVPLAGGAEEAAFGTDEIIDGVVDLVGDEFVAGPGCGGRCRCCRRGAV